MSVSIVRANLTNAAEKIGEALQFIHYKPRKKKIFIKPNIVNGYGSPDNGVITHPVVYVSCMDYGPEQVRVRDVDDVEGFVAQHRPAWTVVRWINVDGLSDMNVIHALARKYDLHPLAIEDLLHRPQRPKCDSFGHEQGHHE